MAPYHMAAVVPKPTDAASAKKAIDQLTQTFPGANVGRMQLPGNQDQVSTPGGSEQYYLPWIANRFAGKSAPDGCADN